jgi:hypothetical protein
MSMADEPYSADSVWPGPDGPTDPRADTAEALAAIAEQLSRIGDVLAGQGGTTRRGVLATPASEPDGPWPGFDPGTDEATTIDMLRQVVGGYVHEARGTVQRLLDYEQARPVRRDTVIRAAQDQLDALSDLDRDMWRQG